MPAPALPDYLRLKRANGIAPHKPILLLAVLKAFDEGLIVENRVEPSGELINLFKGYWEELVHDPSFKCRFFLPFFFLRSEPSGIWKLHADPGFEQSLTRGREIKSLRNLLSYNAYATLLPAIYRRWLFAEEREVDRQLILAHYFKGREVPVILRDYLVPIEEQILNESPVEYAAKARSLFETDIEEGILRGAAFKRKIPELYDHRCAITGLRVQNRRAVNLIDACHIVPWADSFDDTISNGIALCPNMHRAFDRGLISIAADHSVLVATDLLESASSHAIRPFAGKRLMLPTEMRHWPAPENLARHRERWGF